jgi:hypothetical protein
MALRIAGNRITESIQTDPTQAAAVAGDIATWDVPPGYEQVGMDFFGFNMVFLEEQNSPAGGQLIMIMQFPRESNIDEEQMEQQMNRAMGSQFNRQGLDLKLVDQTTATIRDEEVTLNIREGSDSEGNQLRQMTGVFTGNGGPALLMVIAPQDRWDQELIDTFIQSIQ